MKNSVIKQTLLLSAFALFLGCASTGKQDHGLNLTDELKDFVQDKSKLPTIVYTRPNVPGLQAYHSFMVDPTNVYRTKHENGLITDQDIVRLKQQFYQKMVSELKNAGLEVVDTPQEDTLRISLALSDLRAPISLSSEMATAIGQQFELGGVTIVAAFSRAKEDSVVAVVMEYSRGNSVLVDTPKSNFSDIEAALTNWARNVSKAIVRAHKS
jgi:hypothetical protein